MKQVLLLCLIIASPHLYGSKLTMPNPFAAYEGKYQITVRGQAGYIQIVAKNKQLTLIETWTGVENKLKQLSGDKFMMVLRGWAIKFNRDAKGKVVSVLVMGRDVWTKVK